MSTEFKNALHFTVYDDCAEEAGKTWIYKDLIALGEDSTWFGPPGSLKSALLLDVAVSMAFRRDWRGHKYEYYDDPYQEPRGTVYFALERADLVKNRIGAYKMRDPFPLPIAIVSSPIDLLDPACVDQIVDTVLEFEDRSQCPVGLIVIDTFSKAIANGDEDKAQTQNIAAKHLREVHDQLSVHIATIGHTGKNPSAGERGSNARLGHVDVAIQISGDKVRTATVVKANDQPERPIASFDVEQVTVTRKWKDGTDREPYTTAILAADTPAKEARTEAFKPTLKQTQALDALTRAIAARGQDGGVQVDYWKEELTKAGLLKSDAKNPWQPFKRIKESLTLRIIEADGIVRLVSPLEALPPRYPPTHPSHSHP
jgi:hypothetical protein